MKANKFILVVMAVFLIQILRGLTLIFPIPSVVIPLKEVVESIIFFLGTSTDKTYFHADHPFKIP